VFDRTENVIYRDVFPPVDLSDAGKADRDAMRQRGEFPDVHWTPSSARGSSS